jgi:hypothetical protein
MLTLTALAGVALSTVPPIAATISVCVISLFICSLSKFQQDKTNLTKTRTFALDQRNWPRW